MKKIDIDNIIVKFLGKEASHEELLVLQKWLKSKENVSYFNSFVKTQYYISSEFNFFDNKGAKRIIKKRVHLLKRRKQIRYVYAGIAAVVVAMAIAFPWIHLNLGNSEILKTEMSQQVIIPGTDKAVLTLENGNKLVLKKGEQYNLENGVVNGDKLIYASEAQRKQSKQKINWNYLTTARGGQFFVMLSDSTKVWLNSETKLKYPVEFLAGKTREVELVHGEAYFEVSPSSKNQGAGFRVKMGTQLIRVLGTQFNIRAYNDEEHTYTTLVEGSVSLSNDALEVNLRKGEQAVCHKAKNTVEKKHVDISQVISWKNGYFIFNEEPLEQIMKTLSRWYDVTITCENEALMHKKFSGFLDRNQSIEKLLDKFSKTNEVSFTFQDKNIFIK